MLSARTRQHLERLAREIASAPTPLPEVRETGRLGGLGSPTRGFPSYDPRACGSTQPAAPAADDAGHYFLVRPDPSAWLEDAESRARVLAAASQRLTGRPDGAAIVDIETTGLAATPLFLIGLLTVEGNALALYQFLARNETEEAALLEAFLRRAIGYDGLVTFNGDRFDLPFIEERAAYHRIPRLSLPVHLDLLPRARERWRGHVPDCRLVTLETAICGRPRVGDVPGSAVPTLYEAFVRTGNWAHIVPILHHNALDLLTTAELLSLLLDGNSD